MARDIDTHTHRIGRTARGGEKGTAFTLVSDKDKEMVGHLVRNLEMANQFVPDDLMELAMQSSWFKKARFKGGKGRQVGGGAGLGFRERPTLGGSSASSYTKAFVSGGEKSSSSSAQPTNRLEALKNAFKSQYTSQFKVSADKTWEQILPAEGVFAKPPLPSSPTSSSQEDQPKKKKSRWT